MNFFMDITCDKNKNLKMLLYGQKYKHCKRDEHIRTINKIQTAILRGLLLNFMK